MKKNKPLNIQETAKLLGATKVYKIPGDIAKSGYFGAMQLLANVKALKGLKNKGL